MSRDCGDHRVGHWRAGRDRRRFARGRLRVVGGPDVRRGRGALAARARVVARRHCNLAARGRELRVACASRADGTGTDRQPTSRRDRLRRQSLAADRDVRSEPARRAGEFAVPIARRQREHQRARLLRRRSGGACASSTRHRIFAEHLARQARGQLLCAMPRAAHTHRR